MTGEPFLSIIIPAYKAEDYIQETLLSLKEQKYPKDKLEIIVIISGEDFTFNICKDIQNIMNNLKVYNYSERISAGTARNIGTSFAKGDILLFIDADCIAPPNWINLIIEDFKEFPEIQGVLGIYSGGKSLVEKALGGELIDKRKRTNEFSSFIEGNCAFRRVVFEKGCKFGDITYGEVLTLTNCMKRNNFKMLLDPNIQIKHFGTMSVLKYCRTGKIFHYWHLNTKSKEKFTVFKSLLRSSFGVISVILLILVPLVAQFSTSMVFRIPLHYFFVIPFIFVNIVFINYIRQDYLLSTRNKLKYFPYWLFLKWIHNFGYFLASLEILSKLFKNKTESDNSPNTFP